MTTGVVFIPSMTPPPPAAPRPREGTPAQPSWPGQTARATVGFPWAGLPAAFDLRADAASRWTCTSPVLGINFYGGSNTTGARQRRGPGDRRDDRQHNKNREETEVAWRQTPNAADKNDRSCPCLHQWSGRGDASRRAPLPWGGKGGFETSTGKRRLGRARHHPQPVASTTPQKKRKRQRATSVRRLRRLQQRRRHRRPPPSRDENEGGGGSPPPARHA